MAISNATLAGLTRTQLLEMHYQMALLRRFEEKSAEEYTRGKIGGFMHLYIGQEAIGVAVMIAALGMRLARSTVETLVDRAPEGVTEKADAAIRTVPGVVDVERLRVRMVGSTHFIDAIVQVPRTYPIDRVDEIKRKAQEAINKALDEADLTFTAVPVAVLTGAVR